MPSYTTTNDQFVIRVCNTNHRTQRFDFDELVEAVVKLGNDMMA